MDIMDRGFKLLLNNMPFPIWMKDMDFKFTYINEAYAKVYDKKKEDFIGLKNEDVFTDSQCKQYNANCMAVIESRKARTYDAYINNRYNQCCIFPIIDENDEIVAIVGIIGILNTNELEEKNYELELQKNLTNQIIDILPGVIFYKDIDSKYVYANKSCRDFYKEKGIDDIVGKTDMELHENKAIAEKFISEDKQIVESKEPLYDEGIIEGKNGVKQYRDVVKIPLLDNRGNVAGIVGRSMDVTKQKETEERLKYLSYTDILTGLKNRAYFEERIVELSKKEHLPLGVIMGDANGLKLVNDTFGHIEGDNLLKQISNVLIDVCKNRGEIFRIGGDEFAILIKNTDKKTCENIIKKIMTKCDEYENDIFKVSIALGVSLKESIDDNIYEILKESEDRVYRHKLLQKSSIKSTILDSLKVGLGVKSIETEEHTNRVSKHAILVGERLDLEIGELDELTLVAELHDIGKIGINEDIILKPDKLTHKEFEVMKTHTEKGYRIVKVACGLENVAKGVLHHHERWDGNGYPMGLKENEIPLISRIINVVDAYDVMTNGRIYKEAMDKEEAINELIKCSGSQFDPLVVDIFIECIK